MFTGALNSVGLESTAAVVIEFAAGAHTAGPRLGLSSQP